MVRGAERTIGARIAEAIREQGISQVRLAHELGTTRSAVSQWISGTTFPTMENLAQVAVCLGVSFEWLATSRGPKEPAQKLPGPIQGRIAQVPLVSWVSAGHLYEPLSQIPREQMPLITIANLPRGEFFLLRVDGDSMDRISPAGSVILVNRADRELIADKPYIFSVRGEATYKMWQPNPPHLAPHSWNAAHKPVFLKSRKDFEVVGRVRRTALDL